MSITYRTAGPGDAEALLKYLRQVDRQTDNLTFGKDGIAYTVEQEAALLGRIAESVRSLFPCNGRGSDCRQRLRGRQQQQAHASQTQSGDHCFIRNTTVRAVAARRD